MKLNSKLALVLVPPGLSVHNIRSSHQRHNAADLSPRSDEIGSGNNNGFDFGDALGTFRGDDKGFHKGSGGDHFRNDDNKGGNNHGKGHGGRDRVAEKKHTALKAAANEEKKKAATVLRLAKRLLTKEDSRHKEADLKNFKKEKK